MLLIFTTILIMMCICIGTLFVCARYSGERGWQWYLSFRKRADAWIIRSTARIYKYTYANKNVYMHHLSQKSKILFLLMLKKVYIGLQYIVRFIRRNIILTAKKVHYSKPSEMLQELRKERDRIMNERTKEGL